MGIFYSRERKLRGETSGVVGPAWCYLCAWLEAEAGGMFVHMASGDSDHLDL